MPANIYESVKKALQDIIAPELKTIQGQIDSLRIELRSEIKRLDEKISGVNEKIENLREETRSMKEEFRLAIDMHERIAALEAKIGR